MTRHTGIGTYIRTLFPRLPELGGTLKYLVVGNRGTPSFGKMPTLTVRSHPLAFASQLLPWELRGVNVELLHIPYITVPVLWSGKLVVTIHDLIPMIVPSTTGSRARDAAFRVWTRIAARKASVIVTVSEHSRRDIIRLLHSPPDKVIVIPPAVGPAFSPPDDLRAIAVLRQKLNAPQFFLYVGRHKPHKNLLRLIRTFRRLAREQHAVLVFAGLKDTPGDLLHEVKSLGLEHAVRFVGYVSEEELPLYYQAATAVVLPSLYEGFGLPALEGMACGTPVIASNRSAIPEVVGDAALLVDPEDEAAMTKAMITLARDADLRNSLRERGLARAQAFSAQASAQKLADVYLKVVREA